MKPYIICIASGRTDCAVGKVLFPVLRHSAALTGNFWLTRFFTYCSALGMVVVGALWRHNAVLAAESAVIYGALALWIYRREIRPFERAAVPLLEQDPIPFYQLIFSARSLMGYRSALVWTGPIWTTALWAFIRPGIAIGIGWTSQWVALVLAGYTATCLTPRRPTKAEKRIREWASNRERSLAPVGAS